ASECRQAAIQNEDAPPEHPVPDLRVCFDWQSKELSVANQDGRALSIYLGADRVPLLSIQYKDESSLILDASQTQSLFANPAVRVGLYGSGDKMWMCLVEERNLHQKPAAPAMERSIDDLLRDWQLGSEQRQAEYIARAAMPDDMRDASTGFSPELDNGVETDRLNDFFMAMHRFRTDILAQLQRTGSLDAFVKMQIQARLFGRGVMSVRYLLEKLRSFQNSEESRQDVVDRYLGLMALRDALQRLQGEVSATGLELATEMNVLYEEENRAIV